MKPDADPCSIAIGRSSPHMHGHASPQWSDGRGCKKPVLSGRRGGRALRPADPCPSARSGGARVTREGLPQVAGNPLARARGQRPQGPASAGQAWLSRKGWKPEGPRLQARRTTARPEGVRPRRMRSANAFRKVIAPGFDVGDCDQCPVACFFYGEAASTNLIVKGTATKAHHACGLGDTHQDFAL